MHGRTLVVVPYAKGESHQIRKSVPYPFCLISAKYSCCCRFALCYVAVCFCSALSMPVCVSASLCSRRMRLHDQSNRPWRACKHRARFDCRLACCVGAQLHTVCAVIRPLLPTTALFDMFIEFYLGMYANTWRASIVNLHTVVGVELHSLCLQSSTLNFPRPLFFVHIQTMRLYLGGARSLLLCIINETAATSPTAGIVVSTK